MQSGSMTKGGAHFGGLTYTRQVPAFLQKMQEQDQDGIAGALKKREGQEEREERSDNEEERPQVVDATEAMTAKERKQHGSDSRAAAATGLFKGDDTASKFSDSAHARHQAWEEQRHKRTSDEAADGSAEAPAADGGRPMFAAPAKKKKKKVAAGGVGASKAVRNTGLLSFGDQEDEAES